MSGAGVGGGVGHKKETVVRRGSAQTVRAWTARGSVLVGATQGFWTPPVLHPNGL